MKTYGHPRHPDLEAPDKSDIKLYGLAGFPDRCGRVDRGKKSSRLIWKKKARAKSKVELRKLINEEEVGTMNE